MVAQRICLPLTLAMLLLLMAGVLLGAAAHALAPDDPGTLYVSASGDCGGMTPCYDVIQDAVDAAAAGDTIEVAMGVYSQANSYGELTQALYITKSITIRGGYTPAFAEPPDPVANPTTLDAVGQGRVVYIAGLGIDVTLEGLRLTGGDATGLRGEPYADVGGGIYAYDPASLAIRDSAVYSNTASTDYVGYGGGLYLKSGAATLLGNSFQGNVASSSNTASYGTGYGGGLYLAEGDYTLTANTIQDNIGGNGNTIYTYGDGGGLYVVNSTVTLTGNTIRGNLAGRGSSGGAGGGFHLTGGTVTFTGNTIEGNYASRDYGGQGGAGYLTGAGTFTITGNIIRGNTAGASTGVGGGLVGYDSYIYPYTSFRIEYNIIEDNAASIAGYGSGGGIQLYAQYGSTLISIRDNRIMGNEAGSDANSFGGGLYLALPQGWCTIPAAISGNLFQGNSALSGGGAYIIGYPAPCFMEWTNNAVVGNQAATGGSGLFLNTRALLRHTTLSGNGGGDSSGVYVEGGTLLFTNTIIYSHTVGLNNAGGAVSLDHTLWDATATHYTGPVSEADPFSGDSAFTPDGYHLTAGSAAINLGAAAGVGHDIDGQHRPAGSAPDVGADEFAFSVYLPLMLRGSPSP